MIEKSMKIIQMGPDATRPGGIRTVMLTLKNSELGKEYGMDIIPTSSKTRRIQTFLHGFRQLKSLIKQGACDCVHIHMSENASVYRAAIMTRWIKSHSCSRVIVQSHGSSVQSFFARCPRCAKKYLLDSLGAADLIVTLTPGWERWWRELLPSARYAVVPNAVDQPAPVNARNANNQREENGATVLFMGQLGERKGTYLLISAIPAVLSKRPDALFVFAGDGEIEQCAAYAKQLGVSDSCAFVGWADAQEKDALLRDASMLVLPSREESFGIVLLEAMSYGVPVVCSDGGFMHEVVDDGKDGIVFPTGDGRALSKAICTLLDDPEISRTMGEAGRLKVEASYTLPVVTKVWKQVYSEVSV